MWIRDYDHDVCREMATKICSFTRSIKLSALPACRQKATEIQLSDLWLNFLIDLNRSAIRTEPRVAALCLIARYTSSFSRTIILHVAHLILSLIHI